MRKETKKVVKRELTAAEIALVAGGGPKKFAF